MTMIPIVLSCGANHGFIYGEGAEGLEEVSVSCEQRQRSHLNYMYDLHSILYMGEYLLFSIKLTFFTKLKIFEYLKSHEV